MSDASCLTVAEQLKERSVGGKVIFYFTFKVTFICSSGHHGRNMLGQGQWGLGWLAVTHLVHILVKQEAETEPEAGTHNGQLGCISPRL